jgi:hypothetical protein
MYKSYHPQEPHYKGFERKSTHSLYHIAAIQYPPSNFSHKGTQRDTKKKRVSNPSKSKVFGCLFFAVLRVSSRLKKKQSVDFGQFSTLTNHSIKCYYFSIPTFHYSIIPVWNMQDDWLGIPYSQQCAGIPGTSTGWLV